MRSLTYLPRKQNHDKRRQPVVIMDSMGHKIRVWPPAIDQNRLPEWYLNLVSGLAKGGAA